MQKIKNLAYLLVVSLVLFSCGEYQKVLNKGTTSDQYKMAVKMYESKKYSKALRLFEKITPTYRGKPQMERISFMIAQSNFNVKNYGVSGYYFDRFAKNYPKSSKKEEASFLSAYSYKLASPTFSLDPTDTNKALEAFQGFINDYQELPPKGGSRPIPITCSSESYTSAIRFFYAFSSTHLNVSNSPRFAAELAKRCTARVSEKANTFILCVTIRENYE